MSLILHDGYDRDSFSQFEITPTMTPTSPRGSPEQDDEEGTMFTNRSHSQVNHVSAPVNGTLDSLFSRIEETLARPRYSDLCLDREFSKNKAVHFQVNMKDKLAKYNVKRKDEVFFRNNAVFDDERLYSLCDHLAINHAVLQQVLAVFHFEGPKNLILDTIRHRLKVKNLGTYNSNKNPMGQSSGMSSTAQHMPGPSSNSRNSYAGIGESSNSNKRRASESSAQQHNHDQSQPVEENEYLLQRERNIAENNRIMQQIGIMDMTR
jgi:hypothetical protein